VTFATEGSRLEECGIPDEHCITSSSDDSDFVNPSPKRNRGSEPEVHNIPWQPTGQAAMHIDGEAAAKKTQKVLLLLSLVDVIKGYLCTVFQLPTTQMSLSRHYM
jgi:hypothetical protein